MPNKNASIEQLRALLETLEREAGIRQPVKRASGASGKPAYRFERAKRRQEPELTGLKAELWAMMRAMISAGTLDGINALPILERIRALKIKSAPKAEPIAETPLTAEAARLARFSHLSARERAARPD